MKLVNTNNKIYKFKFRRPWQVWRTLEIKGHKYVPSTGHMDLYLADSTIYSIPKWHECYMELGLDFVLIQQESIKEEAGK